MRQDLGRPRGWRGPNRLWRRVYALGLAALFILSSGVSALRAQEPPPPPAASPPARDYLIGPQDLLAVTVFESPELSREVRVAADGTISLPLLAERIRVLGLSLAEAEDLIRRKYVEAGILNHPNVSVAVRELLSRPVTVSGSVRNPGIFQLGMQVPLLRVVTQAGGLGDDAGGVVQIIRGGSSVPRPGENPEIISVRIDDLMQGRPEANLPVYGGDTVNVPPAGVVYVVGAVNRPGRFSLRSEGDQLTVLRVVALAENLKPTARPSQAVLIRKDPARCPAGVGCGPEDLKQIPVDVKKILRKEAPDVPVLPNDVLFIPDSVGKRALARGLEAAIQIATGVVVFR